MVCGARQRGGGRGEVRTAEEGCVLEDAGRGPAGRVDRKELDVSPRGEDGNGAAYVGVP